jgi:hypothetical protein
MLFEMVYVDSKQEWLLGNRKRDDDVARGQ